jgi:hypothetical protein
VTIIKIAVKVLSLASLVARPEGSGSPQLGHFSALTETRASQVLQEISAISFSTLDIDKNKFSEAQKIANYDFMPSTSILPPPNVHS